jgi:hypothetical protein
MIKFFMLLLQLGFSRHKKIKKARAPPLLAEHRALGLRPLAS